MTKDIGRAVRELPGPDRPITALEGLMEGLVGMARDRIQSKFLSNMKHCRTLSRGGSRILEFAPSNAAAVKTCSRATGFNPEDDHGRRAYAGTRVRHRGPAPRR